MIVLSHILFFSSLDLPISPVFHLCYSFPISRSLISSPSSKFTFRFLSLSHFLAGYLLMCVLSLPNFLSFPLSLSRFRFICLLSLSFPLRCNLFVFCSHIFSPVFRVFSIITFSSISSRFLSRLQSLPLHDFLSLRIFGISYLSPFLFLYSRSNFIYLSFLSQLS